MDARLVDVLSERDIRDIEQLWEQHIPKHWPLVLGPLLLLPVSVLLTVLWIHRYPLIWLSVIGAVLLLMVLLPVDSFLAHRRVRRLAPALVAQVALLNADFRRRGFQLLVTSAVSDHFRFAIELGAQYRTEPLARVDLMQGNFGHGPFWATYSLAVAEVCGEEYAEHRFVDDVEQLNRVPPPRWPTLGFVLNMLSPILFMSVYFVLAFLVGLVAPSVAEIAFHGFVLAVLCPLSMALTPLLAYFRRRGSKRYVDRLAAVVRELRDGADWHWRFYDPISDNGHAEETSPTLRRARALEMSVLRVMDFLFHLGPQFSVKMVRGPRREHEMDIAH